MKTIRSLLRGRSLNKRAAALVLGLAVPALYVLAPSVSAQTKSEAKDTAKEQATLSAFVPAATVQELMEFVIMPAAGRLWNAVSISVTKDGVIENGPKTDKEWAAVRGDALVLAEIANALMIPGREIAKPHAESEAYPEEQLDPAQLQALRDKYWGAWVGHSRALHEAVMESVKAIDKKDKDALSNAGSTLDEACEGCHLQFWYPPQPEAEKPQPEAGN